MLRPLLPLRKARMTTGKVSCYPGRARGSLRAVREFPTAPGWGGSPPVPSWSVPGGFGAKLPSPAQTRRGKLRISLWAPKSLPAKAEAQVPGGVHGGTGRVPLVHSSLLPRARRARHPLCPPCTALRAPFPPRGTGPGAHPEARSCVVTRLCACLGLRAAAQAAALPGPGPLACGRLPPLGISHGSGAGAPPTTSPAGSEPAGVPWVVHPAQETALSTSNHARSASVRSQAAWPQGGPGSRLPAPEPAAGWRPPPGQLAASSPLARVGLAELVPRGPRGRPCGGDVGAGTREPQRRRWACGYGRGVTARGEAPSEDA